MAEFQIGTSLEGMELLTALTVPITVTPIASFEPYADYATLASGRRMGLGAPVATWTFPVLEIDERDQLREFCTGASATVYIRTAGNDNDDAYANYQAVMHWPDAEERPAGLRHDFVVRFTHLVEQEEVS